MPRRSPASLRRDRDDDRRGPAARRPGADADPVGGRDAQRTREGTFLVRSVAGQAARKTYRCPGCQQQIPVGTPHVVVWPAEDPSWLETAAEARRHWHPYCWHRRSRRGPGPG